MESLVAVEGGEQLGRELGGAIGEVGPEDEVGLGTDLDAGSGLHLLVDDDDVTGLIAGSGEEGGTEGVAVDGAGDAAAEHVGPLCCAGKGYAGDGPLEAGVIGLEEGAEGAGGGGGG